MTDIDYAERVQRGIALLDEKWPAWATEIDLDRLDIGDGSCCATAQYYVASQDPANRDPDDGYNWANGQGLLELDGDEYVLHGFNGEYVEGVVTPDVHEALNGLWKAAIVARRAQAQDAPAEPGATA